MSIIKCPVCRGQVSTMAGTCPHCGIKISSQLRTCPQCGSFCLVSQEECPECNAPLELPQKEEQGTMTQKDTKGIHPRKERKKASYWGRLVGAILFLILCSASYYFYNTYRMQQKEQAEYERLAEVTNPEFYQQFLIDYPESEHYDKINERMHLLQAEAREWEQLLKGITRSKVSSFLQNHPSSLRQRLCEDMLDSIDWHEAQAIGNEEAVTNYLAKHPSGRYVTEAAEKKNALLLTKVTPTERTMIRGTLEAFFSKAIANQDIEAVREAIPDSMAEFCGKQNADAETIVQYARNKMDKDVIGLHYAISQKMEVRKETLPDGNTGFAVEVNVQETISRSDTNQPTSDLYRVTALLNQEQKIVRLNVLRD